MSLQNVPKAFVPLHPYTSIAVPTSTDSVIDAADEAVHLNGTIRMPGGYGTSKTISAAGSGRIFWNAGPATFANAGTTLRIGIQDVSTGGFAGRGDGTFDVYGDLVGGGGGITASAQNVVTMGTGTKTLTHRDDITISMRLISRAGADSVAVRSLFVPVQVQWPNSTVELAGVFTAQFGVPTIVIEFDDDTLGFIDLGWPSSTSTMATSTAYHSGSAVDEIGMPFILDEQIAIDALFAFVGLNGTTSDYELILYGDPFGTPVVVEAISVDSSKEMQLTTLRFTPKMLSQLRTLDADVQYMIAVRPTTTNIITLAWFDVPTASHLDGHIFGQNATYASRSDQSGPFTNIATRRALCGYRVAQAHDGVGGAGGMIVHPGMSGGMRG